MKALVPPTGLNKLYLQINQMRRGGLQVEDYYPPHCQSLPAPNSQLAVSSRNHFDRGEEVLTSKTEADQAEICHPPLSPVITEGGDGSF